LSNENQGLTAQTTGITDEGVDDGGDVDESRSWINDLPDDLKDAKTWNRFTKGDDTRMVSVPESVLKTHLSLEGMLGDRNKAPETDEELNQLRTNLGWKEDYEDYSKSIERREMPDGIEYDQSEEDFLLQMAHESGVSVKDAQARYDAIVDSKLKQLEMQKSEEDAYRGKVEDEYKNRYGGDLNLLKNRGMAGMRDYADDNLIKLMETAEVDGFKLGDHPLMFGLFEKLGKESLGLGNERGRSNAETGDAIQEQINSLMKSDEYRDQSDVGHSAAVKKMFKLQQRLAGEI
jgi:hypothetical protein